MISEPFKQYTFLQNRLIKAQSDPRYKPIDHTDLTNRLIPLWDKLDPYEKNDAWNDYHKQLIATNPIKTFAGVIEERYKDQDIVWTSLYDLNDDNELQAELLINEFTTQDQTLIQPGARFYWYVYEGRTILAMMKDAYTPEDIAAADEWVEKHLNWFK